MVTRAERRAAAMLLGLHYHSEGDWFYTPNSPSSRIRYDPDTMEVLDEYQRMRRQPLPDEVTDA